MSPSVVFTGLSDIGRVRRRNEDSLFIDPDRRVVVVADGMGGHPGGDVASRIATGTISERLIARVNGMDGGHGRQHTARAMASAMAESVLAAHGAILDHGARVPGLAGMGTTAVAMLVGPGGSWYVLGHVGDSRCYRLREGELTLLTRDDTWVQQQVDADEITHDQARDHPYGHVLTQCLGLDRPPTPHIQAGETRPGDVFMLCSDGLVGMLDDADLGRLLEPACEDPDGASRALVDAANARGGRDNITVAIVLVANGARPDASACSANGGRAG